MRHADFGLEEVGFNGGPESEVDAPALQVGNHQDQRGAENGDREVAGASGEVQSGAVQPFDRCIQLFTEHRLASIEAGKPGVMAFLFVGESQVRGEHQEALDKGDGEDRDHHRGDRLRCSNPLRRKSECRRVGPFPGSYPTSAALPVG